MATTQVVQVEQSGSKIYVTSPYLPELPAAAKKLGGKWSGKRWVFDVRDIGRVKSLYGRLYGEDGEHPAQMVSVRVTCTEDWHSDFHQGLFLFGRQVARAFSRDSGVMLGEGVVVLEGNIDSGGSRRYWRVIADEGTVFEIRDVPLPIIENADLPKGLEWEIVPETKGQSREELEQERERLLARVREINNILKTEA